MRGGNALFLIIEIHGLEREGGVSMQKIYHINAVCFPLFAFWFCDLGARGRGLCSSAVIYGYQ